MYEMWLVQSIIIILCCNTWRWYLTYLRRQTLYSETKFLTKTKYNNHDDHNEPTKRDTQVLLRTHVKNKHVLSADKLLWTLFSYNTATQSTRICFYIAEFECSATFPRIIMRRFFKLTPQSLKNERKLCYIAQHQWGKDITFVSTLHYAHLHITCLNAWNSHQDLCT
jgi:hypothetical protein